MDEAHNPFTSKARALWDTARCAPLLAALLLAPLVGRTQEIYKSVDASGHVVFSDRGTSKTSPKTSIHVEPADAANAARLAKEQQLLDADEQQRKAQQARDDKSKAQQDARAHQREQRCQSAKDRYYAMKDSNRLFRRDADGNRVYYTDDEADKKREEARRTMQAACGT